MNTFQDQFSLECALYDLQISISARIDAERRRDESLARNKVLEEQLKDAEAHCKILESIRDLVCMKQDEEEPVEEPHRRTSTRSVKRVNYKE